MAEEINAISREKRQGKEHDIDNYRIAEAINKVVEKIDTDDGVYHPHLHGILSHDQQERFQMSVQVEIVEQDNEQEGIDAVCDGYLNKALYENEKQKPYKAVYVHQLC